MKPQSMTGYGKGMSEDFKVEIRSSNHKNIDIHINAPYYLFSYEAEIRKRIKQKFSRGRIDVYVPKQELDNVKLKVNTSLAREYYNALSTLKDELSIADDIGINILASQRDIFSLDEPDIDVSNLYNALDMAIKDLEEARAEEGENLVDDIKQRIDLLKKLLSYIEDKRVAIIDTTQQKLHDRLKELLENVSVDESRLIQEAAILIEKADITEEIVRIKSHLGQVEEVLKYGDTIGKKLDFLVQELRREVNTIGNKSQDVEIANNVVEIKHELEKIREQVQNLQ